jgi:hypothetical protein
MPKGCLAADRKRREDVQTKWMKKGDWRLSELLKENQADAEKMILRPVQTLCCLVYEVFYRIKEMP